MGLNTPFGVIVSEFRRVASLFLPPENKLSAPKPLVDEFLAVINPVVETIGGILAVRFLLCVPEAAVDTLWNV
jgi:hypothetical protein